jgi:cytochrome P450
MAVPNGPVEPRLGEILSSAGRDSVYSDLLSGPPVVPGRYLDGTLIWLVTGYDEIVRVLTDPRFSNDLSRQDRLDIPGRRLPEDLRPTLTSMLAGYDPPDHTRLRRLLSHAFTVRRVQQLRPRIELIVDGLLADLVLHLGADGTVDLMEHFAHQLPIRVIGELLGVPSVDQRRWRSWAAGLTSADPVRMTTDARGLVGYMTELIAARAADGQKTDDLLGALVQAREADGDRLSEPELVSTSLSILIAGHRTTAALVRTAAWLVLAEPTRFAVLRKDPARIPVVVEEILRRHGPAEIGAPRFAREPVQLAGVTIAAGDPVQVILASGNRDPRRFAEPDTLNLTRTDNAHLAFGHGVHYCLGASLARVMAELALAGLLRASPDLTPTADMPPLIIADLHSATLPVRVNRPMALLDKKKGAQQ